MNSLGRRKTDAGAGSYRSQITAASGSRLVRTFPFPGSYQATITGSWIVYAVWPLVAAILAMLIVLHRDV